MLASIMGCTPCNVVNKCALWVRKVNFQDNCVEYNMTSSESIPNSQMARYCRKLWLSWSALSPRASSDQPLLVRRASRNERGAQDEPPTNSGNDCR